MIDIEKVDNYLYKARYGLPIVGNYKELWDQIKVNKEILKESISVTKDKFNTYDVVKGLAICEAMLIDYEFVDKDVYNKLISTIYSNTDIARIVIDGASNGGNSYLLMSLWNHDLKLTEEQKEFAVNEAMNKIGTTRINGNLQYTILVLSRTQAHGSGCFDIRYHILRNPNWTMAEKQKLIMEFWADRDVYEEFLEEWEWAIVNDSVNFKGNSMSQLDKFELYEYTYDMLLEFYDSKEITDRIWEEIQFCKQMHKLRPMKWETENKISSL